MHGEQLKVRHYSSDLGGIRRQRLVTVNADEEMTPFRQMQGERNPCLVAVLGLRFPLITLSYRRVGALIPDDGDTGSFAVLHHWIAAPVFHVLERLAVGVRR